MDMNTPWSSIESRLSALGIDMASGLEFCAGSEDFYMEVLNEYADSPVDGALLKKHLDSGDLKEYRTLVHGIKSSSKIIGAQDMFSRAEKLEFAARDEDMDYINSHHDDFIKDYEKLISEIRAL
ncbi:MAG: Hpt domain-containing protein [Lachnospiraceae bacterium]|nr:Hpt domain-containing protein [Lachnospiraceae bacterium]